MVQATNTGMNRFVKPITRQWNGQYTKVCPIQMKDREATGWKLIVSTNRMNWLHPIFPFLKKAFETHLTYFPSSQNGLNEVENLIFNFINIRTCSFTEIFQLENLLLPILLDAFSPPPPTKFIFQENSRT